MSAGKNRAVVASLAHGLAHEIAALSDARSEVCEALRRGGDARAREAALARLDKMIEFRKARVAGLSREVSCNA